MTYSHYVVIRGWPIASLPEGTIGLAFVLLFDTVVISVTLCHILGTWHLQKRLKFLQQTSLTKLVLQQGESCLCVFIMGINTAPIRHPTIYVCMQLVLKHWCFVLIIINSDLLSFLECLFLWLMRQGCKLFLFSCADHLLCRSYRWISCFITVSQAQWFALACPFWHICTNSAIVSVFQCPSLMFFHWPIFRLSVILICHFVLDIRQRNDHPNGTSWPSQPIGTFRAVAQCVHNVVIEEFGDPSYDEALGKDQAHGIECQVMHSYSTEAAVDLQEFPWAVGVM